MVNRAFRDIAMSIIEGINEKNMNIFIKYLIIIEFVLTNGIKVCKMTT